MQNLINNINHLLTFFCDKKSLRECILFKMSLFFSYTKMGGNINFLYICCQGKDFFLVFDILRTNPKITTRPPHSQTMLNCSEEVEGAKRRPDYRRIRVIRYLNKANVESKLSKKDLFFFRHYYTHVNTHDAKYAVYLVTSKERKCRIFGLFPDLSTLIEGVGKTSRYR